jgi:signal transduction histidine kinase
MDWFVIGILLGLSAAAIVSAGAGVWAYRRYVVLERRTIRAERLAELGTLTAGLAHEIKNPLSTIQLNLQLLQEDLPAESLGGSRVHSRLRTVRQEASRLREILDDFLKYAGNLTLDREMLDVNILLDELCDFFAPQASANKVNLRFLPSASPLMASVDAKLIKQALLNLMLNATQAMSGGGELMLTAERQDKTVVLSVTDTGPGIASDDAKRIFEAYYTTKKGGTGLGLPMTRRIVEEHGGSVHVQSEPGRGTRFELRLPLATPPIG